MHGRAGAQPEERNAVADSVSESRNAGRHSAMSVTAFLCALTGIFVPAAAVFAAADLVSGQKNRRHILSCAALAVCAVWILAAAVYRAGRTGGAENGDGGGTEEPLYTYAGTAGNI